MTTRLLRTTVSLLGVMIAQPQGHPLRSQTPVDRMETLVQADRSVSAASWKLGLQGAMLEAFDAEGALLLPGAPLVVGAQGVLHDPGNATPPFASKITWDPLGLEISADSSLALMWGVALLTGEAEAPATGRFVCVWRYSDTGWKIAAFILQGPAFAYKGPALTTAPAAPPNQRAEKFFKADRDFARLAADSGAAIAFQKWAAPDAMMFGQRGFIIRGSEIIGKAVDGPAQWSWAPVAGGGSSTGDLGWTSGEAVITPEEGTPMKTKYLTVWRTGPNGSVRFILDAGNARP